jgi:hypothetical protein
MDSYNKAKKAWADGKKQPTPTPSPHFCCKRQNIKDLSRYGLFFTIENK